MLELTLRGNCPHCQKPLNASALASTDVVPPELPERAAVVIRGGKRYAVAGQTSDQRCGGMVVTYELVSMEKD
jgi:hypothetical protein